MTPRQFEAKVKVTLHVGINHGIRRFKAIVRHPHHHVAAVLCCLIMSALGFTELSHYVSFFVYAIGESIVQG